MNISLNMRRVLKTVHAEETIQDWEKKVNKGHPEGSMVTMLHNIALHDGKNGRGVETTREDEQAPAEEER